MMKTSFGKLVVVLLSLLISFTCFAQQTLTVPDDYTTIQAAIDAADSGDTVYIKVGRYTENIFVSEPINLATEDCSRQQARMDVTIPAFPSLVRCHGRLEMR